VPVPDDIAELGARLKAWLFDDALRLWWEGGTDHQAGGFFEALRPDGRPVPAPRRLRVVARQIFVFAQAGRMGWTGPWRQAVEHGLAALTRYRRPEGLYRFSLDDGGAPVDDSAQPYEQAFALLALSAAHQALGAERGFETLAVATRQRLAEVLGRPDGGVHDDASRGLPLRANPLMHLFEASLAWRTVGADPGWADLADRIARLAREHLRLPSGALPELFDDHWRATQEAEVEPGHQFEWGALLLIQAALAGEPDTRSVGQRLIALGERGVDPARGVVIASQDQAGRPGDPTARLWPQTERLRAGVLLAEIDPPAGWAIVRAGAESLQRYLDAPLPGLWRERMEAEGGFRDEPSPASSLYHLLGPIQALDAL
jgi:mannose/cellobiose epimerase-like protein (N-acyl-D-glucosamine 2-epimerase family)